MPSVVTLGTGYRQHGSIGDSMDPNHFIHSAGGKLDAGTRTTPAEIDQMVRHLTQDASNHLILHFQGGLVSERQAEEAADAVFKGHRAGGYPVFHFWELSAFEAFYNNLDELRREAVLKSLLRRVLVYCLQQMSAEHISPGLPGTLAVEATSRGLLS